MPNADIANLLYKIADILEYQNVQWKPQAYRKAARQIEALGDDVADIFKEKGKKGLDDIPGVGKGIAEHIAEYLATGKVKKFEDIIKKAPKGVHEMTQVQGLGPKKVKKLIEELNIKSLDELKAAIQHHKLQGVEGFGEKTEKNLLKSLSEYQRGQERMLIHQAMQIARAVISHLQQQATPQKIEYAGSLRRMKETIGDIDILVQAKKQQKKQQKATEIMDAFVSMPNVKRVISHGPTRSSVVLKEGCNVDIRVFEPGTYGAGLLYFTGSKDHNIELRQLAIKQGYKLSEYGLFNTKTNKLVAGKTEEEVYARLGLQYIPPEMRERRGEVALAKQKKIPTLVELGDMKGDLQMHTTYSDGGNSITDMAKKAKELGYEYIALTDHSQSQHAGNGMSIELIKKQWKEIDKVVSQQKITILKGSEVDIMPDGSLDYPDSILKKLDLVLCSVHTGFKMPEKAMTKRICTALENKYLHILAHPTGRLIGKREPFAVDLDKVFKAAAFNNKIVEINAQPARLDLNDVNIHLARKYKVKFSISTDSHSASSMEFMKYGVGMARRGWVEKKDVVNTLPLEKLQRILKQKAIEKNC
ncbi:DNA polymerase/3'-5' exonuclease PolX [Candidatus Woesearchaeota archaeon]|nr:DNA polymerase/3'-5' exonuclease PolX [Candidatus Woesearchaeota archaeon]